MSITGKSNMDSAPENRSESSSVLSTKSDDRPRKRPCVIWRTTSTIRVLVMSRFDGVNVADPNVHLFNYLTREYVLKRLVTVPTKPLYGGRTSISAATNSPIKTVNTNWTLIPAIVPKKCKCKLFENIHPFEELHYVNEILRQIGIEESEEQTESIQAVNYPPPSHNDDVNNQDDNSSSSA